MGLVHETRADFLWIKPFWEWIVFFYIYINYCNSMNHHLLVKSFLRDSETNSFSSMFLRNCHNQFKQCVKFNLLVFHHHATSNNTFKSPVDYEYTNTRRSSVSIVPDLWEYFIVYVCSWKKCTNTLSIWHHVCLSARKRNHKSRRTTNQTLKHTRASWQIITWAGESSD